MRFFVRRGYLDVQPCDDAVMVDYWRRDERTTDDPTKIPAYEGKSELANSAWYKVGKNHRVENGRIVRDVPDRAWAVEVMDLDALLRLAGCYGGLSIEPMGSTPPAFCIKLSEDQ